MSNSSSGKISIANRIKQDKKKSSDVKKKKNVKVKPPTPVK
jgi:hypothetical protein